MPVTKPFETIKTLFERLGYEIAERNDHTIAQAVANHEEIDSVHNLDQAGLLDAFTTFLRVIGFLDYLEKFTPSVRERFMVPSLFILLTYMVKTLLGIDHIYAMPNLLFSDPAMMKVIGFNARWLEDGLCKRSHEKRTEGAETPKPFCAQMVANFVADLLVTESAAFFNQVIKCLARFGVFTSEVTVVIDGTDVETTQKCQGAGKAMRERPVRGDRQKKPKKVEIVVFGFKAVVAFDLATQIPVAVIVTKIQCHESQCHRHLIYQAQRNLAPGGARVTKVVMDRGFLDGPTMHWIDQQGIIFVVPAKKKMHVYTMAHAFAAKNEGHVQTRTKTVTRGHGKSRVVENLMTEVIGIENLPFLDTYNDTKARKQIGRRGYKPKPLQAVVVRTWENEEYGPGGKLVLLTNQAVTRPFVIFDDYDNRSLIENILFREGKQGWSLQCIPQKTQRAAVAHIFITFAMVALTTAYREWMREEQEEMEAMDVVPPSLVQHLGLNDMNEPQGVRQWRIELKKRVKDYVIVFNGPSYGIFHVMEFAVLVGSSLKLLPKELGTREEIFRRYGLSPPGSP